MASRQETKTGTILQSVQQCQCQPAQSCQCQPVQFQWEIKDIFSYMDNDESFSLRSPDFAVAGFHYFLRFFPVAKSNNEMTSLFLYFKKNSAVQKELNFIFGVKNMDGTVTNYRREINYLKGEFNHTHPLSRLGKGYPRFLKRSKFVNLAPSGDLTLTCTFRHNGREEPISKSLTSLSEDLLSMFTSKTGCDATVNVQGKEFPVHKSILMSRSPVFKAMFQVDMKEKITTNIEIEDCTPEVFQDFLTYLYSGVLKNSANDLLQLYYIAHKYDVKQLMPECVHYLMTNISVDNVFDAIIIGHQFNKANLKTEAQHFFNENFTQLVLNSKWNSLLKDNFALSDELMKNLEKYIGKKPISQGSPSSINLKRFESLALFLSTTYHSSLILYIPIKIIFNFLYKK